MSGELQKDDSDDDEGDAGNAHHLTRKIESETDESWYDSFYHCLRMEMDEYYRIKHRLRVLKANTDYEEELYEEAV